MVSEKNTKISPFFRQCFVTTAVCCSGISSCGCAIGFLGVLLPQLEQSKSMSLTRDQISWIASAGTIPMFLGMCFVPTVMERAGRRVAHFMVILSTLLSWIIMMLATNYATLLFGMILQGVPKGMIMPLRTVLISEYTSPRHRGAFLAMNSFAQIAGILLVHTIGSLISYKMTALVSMSISVISLLFTIYSPETPSWLATRGQYDKCRDSFMWLRSQEELPELEELIDASKRIKSTKKHALKEILAFVMRKEFYKPTIIMCALFSMVNFSDATLLVVFPIPILKELMGPKANPVAWMVALDIQNLVYTGVAVYVVNTIKRRTLLFTSGVACILSQLGMAAYLFATTKGWLSQSIWVAGTLICIEMFCISIGLLPLCSVVAGEVFPLQFRSYCESISWLTCFGPVFLILKTYLDLLAAVGLHGVFGMYAGVMTAGLAVAGILLPETSGITLQQIENSFRGVPLVNADADEEGITLQIEEESSRIQ